jgi:hypothetical protein
MPDHYRREWSPMWGHQRTRCTCGGDDPDEMLWAFVAALLGLAAAVVTLVATILRRPLLAATLTALAALGGLAAVLVWGWPW